MDPQVEPFIQTIDQLHDDIYRAVAPLTDAEINWRYPHLSTTIGILMRHITGSERYRTVQNGTERYRTVQPTTWGRCSCSERWGRPRRKRWLTG